MSNSNKIKCTGCGKRAKLGINEKNLLVPPAGWLQETIPDRLVGGYKVEIRYYCERCLYGDI